MKIYGIVAEFNPFHNGHKYLIDSLKEKEPTAIIAIMMSGAFTQRGEVAIFDKWTRAKMALLSGADLIFELPQVYATSSMAYFAKGAIESLVKTGSLSGLAFGSECNDAKRLKRYSSIVRDEPKAYKIALKETLKQGFSYSQAQYEALSQFFSDVPQKESPNDRLAIQYLSHLPKEIEVFTVQRQLSHDSVTTYRSLASASYLREVIYQNKGVEMYLPKEVDSLISESQKSWHLPKMSDYFTIFVAMVLNLSSYELRVKLNLTDGYENRLKEVLIKAKNYDDFLNQAQTRQYTRARINRLMLNLLSEDSIEDKEVAYLRLLGMSTLGKMALKQINQTKQVPLINALGKTYDALDYRGKKMLDLDIKRQNLQLLFQNREIYPMGLDFFTSPIVL